ncbi:hypothetical protein ACE2AJ_18445 [Aquihabitans daechungensis]|uniref:hypothetical protein n=1 Tax=Aquihabitans daechungensis TaxID=1052257 RepID=UPI003B9EB723
MASLSFRDRFFSPPVARALTSPSGIIALGAGAAIGILATIGTGGLLGPVVGGLLGGALGYGGRVAVAIPRNGATAKIDPFGVNEPWRHAVKDAIQARSRYTEAIKAFRDGPLRDALHETGDRIDEAVNECWKVAQQGQLLSTARKRIDDREIQWELQQAAGQIPAGASASPTQARTIASLNAQMETARRMDALISSTYDELRLINARLDEAVTQAIELSVTNHGDLSPVSSDVEDIVDSLTALRTAMTSLSSGNPQDLDVTGGPPATTPGAERPEPPSGQAQTSPGS